MKDSNDVMNNDYKQLVIQVVYTFKSFFEFCLVLFFHVYVHFFLFFSFFFFFFLFLFMRLFCPCIFFG